MFVKGKSGNPNGRPKKYTILDYITHDEVIELLELAKNGARKGDMTMVKTLLEHVFGKPKQIIAGGEDDDGNLMPIEIKIINPNGDKI